ncbi:MAG TPA: ArsB/NhaD family transporter [Pseudonocardia sp.]
MTGWVAEVVALVALGAVLAVATLRPLGLPEAVAAVPAAALLVLLGVVSPERALAEAGELGPTVGFLAAILVLAHLADREGVFGWLGVRLATASRRRPTRLLGLVFVAASVTTAVLSLDATVVLLTPVVLGTATRLRVRAEPSVYACAHLSNSASLLLPVSNLTNLLAFAATGLTFTAFAGLMTLPWLVAIAVEYVVLRLFFRAELRGAPSGPDAVARAEPAGESDGGPAPKAALAALALTLAGFGVCGTVGVQPVWVAVIGAAVLAGLVVARGRADRRFPAELVTAASPLFCVFVLALGVVVAGVTAHGLGTVLTALLPERPTLLGLLGAAALAATLANLVNNLPATLALVGVLGPGSHPGLVLALLLGVNIGPNLTYLGSLATLLWRRVLTGRGAAPSTARFLRLGVLATPVTLLAAVLALWLSLAVAGA